MSITAETEAAYESYAMVRPNAVLQSVFLCKDAAFHRWIEKRLQGCWGEMNESMATNFLREYCHITSRSELSANPEALQRFEKLLNEFKNSEVEHAA